MRICLINNRYKPYQTGGAERIVELISLELIKSGHEVFIISTCPYGKKPAGRPEEPKIYYLRSLFLSLIKIPKAVRFIWHMVDMFDIGGFLLVYRILNREKPDLVVSHNIKGLGQLSFLAIRLLGIEQVHYLHDIQLLHPSGLILWGQEKKLASRTARIYRYLSRKFVGSPKLVISPSKWLLDTHEKFNFFKDSRKKVLFNPIDLEYIGNEMVKAKLKKDNLFRLIYIGHMTKEKGFGFLLSAFAELKKKITGIELVLIGNAPEESKNILIANNDDKIKYLGFLPPNEVIRNMSRSSLFVMPCLNYENSPTVIYEAVSLGVPVLAARLGGIPELVGHFGGDLFEPGDRSDFIKQVLWVYRNEAKASLKARRSRELIKSLDIKNYIKLIINEIDE